MAESFQRGEVSMFMLAFDFDQISPTQLGVAAVLATLGIIYVASRRQRNPDPLARHPRRETSDTTASVRSLQGELGTLITELESLSVRLSAEAESRESKLQELIAQADERIVALQSQLNSAAAGRSLGQGAVGGSSLGPMPTLRSLVAPASSSPSPAQPTDDRHRAIYSLADEGLSAVEISQRTGQRIGEVELILNLRPKSPTTRRQG